MKLISFLMLAALLGVAISGCSSGTKDKQGGSDKLYDIKGKVMTVDSKKPAVTLDHEDIPGLMKGMEMEFRVESAKLVEGLKAGDQVQGKLKKTDSGYLITQLEKR
jgi:protein SCO1/2